MLDNNNHNKKITCKCRQKREFPRNNECCTSCVIYKATINNGEKTTTTACMSQGKFKDRLTQHKHTFKINLKSTKYYFTIIYLGSAILMRDIVLLSFLSL